MHGIKFPAKGVVRCPLRPLGWSAGAGKSDDDNCQFHSESKDHFVHVRFNDSPPPALGLSDDDGMHCFRIVNILLQFMLLGPFHRPFHVKMVLFCQ